MPTPAWTPYGWHNLPSRDTPLNSADLEAFGQYVFNLAVAASYPQVDTALNGGTPVTVGLTALDLFNVNPNRIEAGFVNNTMTGILYYRLDGVTATAANGIPVPPQKRIVITSDKGRISAIGSIAGMDIRTWEL